MRGWLARWPAAGPVAIASALLVLAVAIAVGDPRPDSLLRHAYLVVVGAAAVRGGAGAGMATAIIAMLVHAPFVLPYVEREGLRASAVEGLATFVILAVFAVTTGALATGVTRARRRYGTLLLLQHELAGDVSLDEAIERVAAVVAAGIADCHVGLVLLDGEERHTRGLVEAPAAVDAALASGAATFIPDLGGSPRPRRAVIAPIVAAGRTLGALVVIRVGEFSRDERQGIVALGAHVGLALENARLAATQRRFAAELADKVAAATRQLSAIDRAKSAFVAVASHELRTPLTALRGFSELLAARPFARDEVQRFGRLMQMETERLVRLIDDLLDLSRLEQGLAPVIRREPVDPAAAIAAVVAVFAGVDARRELEVDCPTWLPPVLADPDALDRILKNLVSNAVKYAGSGPIRLSAATAGGVVEFVVADQGPGIPAEALPRLFEPYFRVPDGTRMARGTGLGLAVVRSLVEAHDGAIRVVSERARGTRVCFTIPCVP